MFTDADIIHSYTRSEAIADGVLIDLSARFPELCSEHFRYPVACTSTVWNLVELAVDESNGSTHSGWIHDILWMSRFPTSRYRTGIGEITEYVCGLPEKKLLRLKLHVGPGDDAEPVITIMLQNED